MISGRVGAVVLIGYLIFVVYGSLVPLDFNTLPLDQAWQRFRAVPFLQLGVESRADWIANGVLYMPLGFLGTRQLLHAGWPRWVSAATALVLGAVVAVGVEFAQVFFPPRTVSLNDLLAEAIGLALGAASALASWRNAPARAMALQRTTHVLLAHGLQLYAAGYVAYSLFPYDVLISWGELEQKLDSDLWGWWLAGLGGRPLIVALQLVLEAALALPLGFLLGQRASTRAPPSLPRAALIGLALGLAIEVAQLFIASGVTQGASVLSRAVGVAAGLALWQRRGRLSLERVRQALRRHALVCAAAYLLLLVAVNGWFTFPWQGLGAASAQWSELRFLPFYYHYYTTEAHALTSLSAVAMMYLPVGVLAWSQRLSAAAAAVCAAVLCLAIETSKLWLAGLRPDPTNLLIAAAACWGFVVAIEAWALRPPVIADPGRAEHGVPKVPSGFASDPGMARRASLVGVVLLVWLLHLLTAPAFAATVALLLAGCAVLVWVQPRAAMLIVPALLPVLDLAPWTGRFFVDEFDVLLTVCLAVGYLRCPAPLERAAAGPWRIAFCLLALSMVVSAMLGAMPWPALDANSLASYYSPYNALRIAKGMVWAGLFLGLLHRLQRSGQRGVRRAVASGMTLGLAYVVLFVVWERLAFVGLFDFSDEYRVTGPFSAMHRGGAFIECYIAVALPFVLLRVIETRRWVVRVGGAIVVLGATYAMMVTFSRNGYAAFVVALSLFLLSLSRGDTSRRRAWFAGVLAAAIVAVALPVLLGSFSQQRLARSLDDLAVRQAHWADALAMRDDSLRTSIFGMGLGRFPVTHFWLSREPVRAASFRLDAEGDACYLRLAGGEGGLYVEQIVARADSGPLRLSLRLRSNKPADVLALSLCEKWMLTSRTCLPASVSTGSTPGAWNDVETAIDVVPLVESGGLLPRPLKFSMHTPAVGSVVDVASISLQDDLGRELLSNADFAAGLDRWFFSTDIDPPWHIHSLPLTILFEQGWLGVVAWTWLVAVALREGSQQAWRGDRHAAAALAALLAFLVSGLLNTLIDEPRFLFLVLLFAGLCCTRPPRRDSVSR